jgi:hypothetical protein
MRLLVVLVIDDVIAASRPKIREVVRQASTNIDAITLFIPNIPTSCDNIRLHRGLCCGREDACFERVVHCM